MAEFDFENIIKKGVEAAINEPVYDGKSITEWAAVGMKAPQWINVEDRVPEDAQDYIICVLAGDGTKHVTIGTYDGWRKRWNDKFGVIWVPDRVTHWMPFPEPLA